jgi:DNA-binding NarL/FixJ family response regulator
MARALRGSLAAIALFCVMLFVPGLAEGRPPLWAEATTAGVSCGVLPWCRRFPRTVYLVALAGTLGSIYLTQLVFPAALPVLVSLYVLGARCSIAVTAAGTVVAVVAVLAQVQLVREIPGFTLRNGTQLGWFVAAAALGVAVQAHRRYQQMAEERTRKAAESSEMEARRRVNEERLRIAQELHDVVGHCIAVINVQAGVAEHLVRRDPDTAEKAAPLWASWRFEAAEALHGLGRIDEARAMAAEELRRARRWGRPHYLGRALRVTAQVTGGQAAPNLLREAVAALDGSPARLEHAKALGALGPTLLLSGHRRDARTPLRQALDLALRCGADGLAEQVKSDLTAAGGRPRHTALSGPEALTPSERRVVDLAVDGHTNRHIAERLFVTPKTVEVHLSASYRKLGITTRAQLADALGRGRQR